MFTKTPDSPIKGSIGPRLASRSMDVGPRNRGPGEVEPHHANGNETHVVGNLSAVPARSGASELLQIGREGDRLEQEADSAADSMGKAELPSCGSSPLGTTSNAQLEGTVDGGTSERPPSIVNNVLNSPGEPLEGATRDAMSTRFDTDFSNVRIHTDARAAQSAEAVGARAYTVGRDIVFGERQYDPAREDGSRLLAHELAHVKQQARGQVLLQRDALPRAPAARPAPKAAGGNILYIGLNAFKLEAKGLRERYQGTQTKVTTVTRSDDAARTVTKGGTFDLTDGAGIDGFAGTLGLDATRKKSVADLLKSQDSSDRDDLAHVIDVYARTDADGADRMSRVVLSGHSTGTRIYGHPEGSSESSNIKFEVLVQLASIFPKAAAQTKHLMVSACFAGEEENLRRFYLKAFPNLQTFSGYTFLSPTNEGSAAEVSNWARKTDADPKKFRAPPSGQSNWAQGVYQGDMRLSGADMIANLQADEPTFNDYFSGAKVDANAHSGWLTTYYGQARSADLNVTSVTGADHLYAHVHAEQSFRLRFWKAQAKHFWKVHGATIRAAYGSAAVPDFGNLSRKDALKAIAEFPGVATGSASDIAAATTLLNGLQTLDETVMKSDWID